MKECWLCGRYGNTERHHIFGGNGRRRKSEKLGLVVDLCHACHNEPPSKARHFEGGVHFNAEAMQKLHEFGQRKAMEEQGWTVEDFIREFGKSYT